MSYPTVCKWQSFSILLTIAILASFLAVTIFFPAAPLVFAQVSDTTPPVGSIVINNGALSTSSNIVTLSVSCNDGSNGTGCSTIQLLWANSDANVNPDVVDVISGIRVSSSLATIDAQADETGPNTGIFVMNIARGDFFNWIDGEKITVTNFPFSSAEGTKSVSATFTDFSQNSSTASDDILLSAGACTSTDKIDLTASRSLVQSTTGLTISTNLLLTAPNSNFDHVSALIAVQRPSSGPGFGLTQNDFFISPGQTKTVGLSFEIPADTSLGNYTYHTSVFGKDAKGCIVNSETIDISLSLLSAPNFTFSSTIPFFSIARGNTSSSEIVTNATANAFGPLKIDFQTMWSRQGESVSPSHTVLNLDTNNLVLAPGATSTRVLSIEPAFVDDPLAADYTGNFTYTVIANGTWTDALGSPHTITRRLDLPVVITEEPFDFALSADKTVLFLEKGTTESVQLDVKHLSGRHFPVTLSTVVAPLALSTKLENATATPDFASRLDVTATDAFSPRDLEVVANGGDTTHTIKIALTNVPFAITVAPESSKIKPGGTAEAQVSVAPLVDKFNSTVSLRISSSQLSPESLALENLQGVPPFSTHLKVKTSPDIAIGNYSVLVAGTDGQFTASQIHNILVSPVDVQTTTPQIRIDLEPRLDSLTIDGSPFLSKDLQVSPVWTVGEKHQLSATREVTLDNSTRYVFDGWSDGVSTPARVFTVSEQSLTIVGKYRPEYLLTLQSEFGQTVGSGWHNASSLAEFGLDKTSFSPSFGVTEIFDGLTGPSASAVDVLCNGEKPADSGQQKSSSSFVICMDKPQLLIATWKEDAGGRNNAIIAGVSISAVAGLFSYFKFLRPANSSSSIIKNATTDPNKQGKQKAQQRNFPQLRWHVYASESLVPRGRGYVDVLLENTGSVDVKKIKILLTTPSGIEYHGGITSIDLMLANESRKVSFVVKHTQGDGPFELTLALSYEFMAKLVKSNDEKKITITIRKPVFGISSLFSSSSTASFAGNSTSLSSERLLGSILGQGNFGTKPIDTTSGSAFQSSLFESDGGLVLSTSDLLDLEMAKALENYLRGGGRALIYSVPVSEGMVKKLGPIAHLLGFAPNSLSIVDATWEFGIKISDSEHPILRELYTSDILRIGNNQQGHFLGGILVDHDATVLCEHILAGKEKTQVSVIPAIISVSYGTGKLVFLNMQPSPADGTVMFHILDRCLLYLAKMLD